MHNARDKELPIGKKFVEDLVRKVTDNVIIQLPFSL